MVDEELKRIGDVAWEAVHNHGAFRRDFRDDAYLVEVGAAVLAAVRDSEAPGGSAIQLDHEGREKR
ncbi:hypothetical protein [Microbacterium sp. K24]|uniref:hypothetical protein n=1 Tax=Microbacterium sp. K24 TaxID=2305446 RepID=UPI00109C5DFC|nr:hypothetical protein [Microbacterium sp. K24]